MNNHDDDNVLFDGKPLPNVLVLPPWATFKIIELGAKTCACGPVHERECKRVAADELDDALAPYGYVVDRAALDALEVRR